MAAAPDLGSGAERRGGSSPFIRTVKKETGFYINTCFLLARVAKLANVAVSEAVGVITLGVRVSLRAQAGFYPAFFVFARLVIALPSSHSTLHISNS